MLTLTENAVTVIRELTVNEQVPAGTGLRIASDAAAGSLTLSLAPEPMEGDQVLDTSGARLFLDSEASRLLDDKALDAAVDDSGGVRFEFAAPAEPG